MERKEIAIGYIRFKKEDTKAYVEATKRYLKEAMSRCSYKLVGYVIDVADSNKKLSNEYFVKRFMEPEFYGAKVIVTFRREMFFDDYVKFDDFMLEAIEYDFKFFSYVDKDLTVIVDQSLSYRDGIVNILDEEY